jgi:hypothetical protein
LSFPAAIRYNQAGRTGRLDMRLLSLLAVVAAVLGAGTSAWAQGQGQPQVPTTVQLPTFSFFTVQTTVSVPDSGGAYLGGIKRARDGSIVRGLGPLRNRAIGSERGAGGMSVHATIIDHAELDEALLAEAAAGRGKAADPATAKAELLSRHMGRAEFGAAGGSSIPGASTSGRASSDAPAESVAAIRQQNSAAAEQRASEAAEYFIKAQTAEAEGKSALAKIYYQMVLRRDAGQLKQQAQARLAAINGGKSIAVAKR